MFVYPPSKQTTSFQTADPHGMRAHNAGIVLRLLWEAVEGVSRAQLSRDTGLSRSTVSSIVNELIESGLVRESHLARSRGGRPPIVLRFHDEHRFIIGLDLGSSHVTIVCTDLRGRVISSVTEAFDVQADPPGTLGLITRLMPRVLPEGSTERVLGIGVGVPCPVNGGMPDQLSARILPAWADVRLASWLFHRWPVPIFVDNDANLGALAEAWWGAGKGHSDFSFIKVSTGVGAGHLIDGRLFRGSSGIAGEIGHTAVDPNGRTCRCGLKGCLEAEIGSNSIAAKARQAVDSGTESSLSGLDAIHFADVLTAAEQGDALSVELIAECGRFLGIAVANMMNLLNPGRIVLGGRIQTAGDLLFTPLRRTVRDRALWSAIERAEIVPGVLGENATALGAGTLVLQAALTSPDLFHPVGDPVAVNGITRLRPSAS
ncbi:MAG: ROK family protein [Myxococcota bacterium]